ncbi:hypothetical protein [Granulicella sp. S190]|uniref:hypothetical protein n=1 Tax=Granulicella sp. S190 TaxID=1747226 RepID=UPI00131D2993|nr:hypothetical protein [Granulicella sp. S190]
MKKLKETEPSSNLATLKLWIEIVQGVATILAIAAGAYWFLLQRSIKPQIKLEQTVTHRLVEGDPGLTLVTVDVRATNIGKVKVELEPGRMELRQINPKAEAASTPTSASVVPEPLIKLELKAMTLEPGESDQALFRAVQVVSEIKTIQVFSVYPVSRAGNKYWNLLSVADIAEKSNKTDSAASTP